MENLSDSQLKEICVKMTDVQLYNSAVGVAKVYNVCKEIIEKRSAEEVPLEPTMATSPRLSRPPMPGSLSPRRLSAPSGLMSPKRLTSGSMSPRLSTAPGSMSPRRLSASMSTPASISSPSYESMAPTEESSSMSYGVGDLEDGYDGYDGYNGSTDGYDGSLNGHKHKSKHYRSTSPRRMRSTSPRRNGSMNGSYNGSMNGTYDGSMNGHKSPRRYQRSNGYHNGYHHGYYRDRTGQTLLGAGGGALIGGAVGGPIGAVGGGLLGAGIGASLNN